MPRPVFGLAVDGPMAGQVICTRDGHLRWLEQNTPTEGIGHWLHAHRVVIGADDQARVFQVYMETSAPSQDDVSRAIFRLIDSTPETVAQVEVARG